MTRISAASLWNNPLRIVSTLWCRTEVPTNTKSSIFCAPFRWNAIATDDDCVEVDAIVVRFQHLAEHEDGDHVECDDIDYNDEPVIAWVRSVFDTPGSEGQVVVMSSRVEETVFSHHLHGIDVIVTLDAWRDYNLMSNQPAADRFDAFSRDAWRALTIASSRRETEAEKADDFVE